MFRDIAIMVVAGAVGLSYGLALAFLGFLAVGLGHGTFVVIGFSSAPCSLAQDVWFALIGGPGFWARMAFLAGGARHWVWRASYLLALSAHYTSLYWILTSPSEFADWSYVRKVVGVFWVAVTLYVSGQVALWG